MAESKGLMSLLMKVKEESEKAGLQINIQEMKIMASGPITSLHRDKETMDLFKFWKWVPQGSIFFPCLFNL